MADTDDEFGGGPDLKQLTLDLFTEIAVLEHLVRNREQEVNDLTAAQFGILNYFGRTGRGEARMSIIAWSFQESDARVRELVDSLRANGLLQVSDEADPRVQMTARGRAKHAETVVILAPEFLPIVQDIPLEDLRITVRTLTELRRTFDNLPDR